MALSSPINIGRWIKMELTSTKDMKAVLNYMNDNDMINIDFIQQQIMMKEREKYLEQHQYEIYKGKDGRWCTYLPAEKNGKRKEIRKKNRTDVEDCVIAHYRSIALEPFIEQVFYEWINNKLECKEIKNSHMIDMKISLSIFLSITKMPVRY